MKNTIPIFLILASIGIFFGYIKPGFGATAERREQLGIYEDTLAQAEQLEARMAELEAQIKGLSKNDVNKLNKLLPKSVNNVNLIIDINNIALGAKLDGIRNIDIDEPNVQEDKQSSKRDDSLYNSLNFSFTVASTYPEFIAFLEALEKSLRLVDVTSVSFAPGDGAAYDFKVTLRTYWLK